jgi:hypothetical protein
MEDVTVKCMNTAKMLGADGRQARDFGDACFVLRNNINKTLKEQARQTILKTELLGKTFGAWLQDMHSDATDKNKKTNKFLPVHEQIALMTLSETQNNFSYGIVFEVMSTLITKQFHDSRL